MPNGLPGNPYAGYATEHDSHAYATLALAHEQRTYNLIALAGYSAEVGARESAVPFIEEVARRLGTTAAEDDEP